MEIINYLAIGVGCIGVLIILWGSLTTLVEFFSVELKRFFGQHLTAQKTRIRHHFNWYLLIGLEYMIGADTIRTISRPTLKWLA